MSHDTQPATNWRAEAACREVDPDAFFAEGRGSRPDVEYAQRVCLGCPVRVQCGQYAINNGEFYGVWGGMSQNQLRHQRRRFINRWDREQGQPPKAPARKREPSA